MILLLTISAIISPNSDITTSKREKGKQRKEEEKEKEKERANKTARVKWGRGK